MSLPSCRPFLKNITTKALTTAAPAWRPTIVLDEWVQKEARPISLKQLTFFARNLNLDKLLTSAEYLRKEIPTRLAHRLRDLQSLPYAVVSNRHISHVYELYYSAFEDFRKVQPIKTVAQNDVYCELVRSKLNDHLTIIPSLAMGVLECRDMMPAEIIDEFVYTLLRSRISRRVIAEHHLALTQSFGNPSSQQQSEDEFIGQVFLKCNAERVLKTCGFLAQSLAKKSYPNAVVPEIQLEGHLNATFPYILSHLEYVIGELLRNSVAAVMDSAEQQGKPPSPIKVLVCEAPQHVIFRFSDQGGGIPRDIMPYLWSFSKGPRPEARLQNLQKVPRLAATMLEVASKSDVTAEHLIPQTGQGLGSLAQRSPDSKLGIGLPMSRIYAEYWAGALNVHSLEGYGTDQFLHISKLGNKNEQLSTRASMDQL